MTGSLLSEQWHLGSFRREKKKKKENEQWHLALAFKFRCLMESYELFYPRVLLLGLSVDTG